MDQDCNTDCEKLDEEQYARRPIVSVSGGDNCPKELTSILSTQYPAIPNQISSTSAVQRSGGPISRIQTPNIQSGATILKKRPIVLVGSQKKLAALVPKGDGRIIVKKVVSGEQPVFQIVNGSLTNLIQMDTAVTADFVLGGNAIKNICSDDPCNCGQRMTLVKIPIEGEPPPEILAVDDTAETDYMTAVNIDVIANDTGTGISVISAGPTASGVVTIEMDGTITFTPAEGITGDVTFTYVIEDDSDQTDTGSVTVTVGEPPEISAINDTINVDYEAGDYNFDPRSNDIGTGLEVTSVTEPTFGDAVVEMDGTITYTPPASLFIREDSFTYEVEDDYGQTDTATVAVNLEWDDYFYLSTPDPITTITGVIGNWRAVATYNTPSGDADEFIFNIPSTALYDLVLQPFKLPKVSGSSSNVIVTIYRPNGTFHSSYIYTATAPKADGVLTGLPTSIEVIATLD